MVWLLLILLNVVHFQLGDTPPPLAYSDFYHSEVYYVLNFENGEVTTRAREDGAEPDSVNVYGEPPFSYSIRPAPGLEFLFAREDEGDSFYSIYRINDDETSDLIVGGIYASTFHYFSPDTHSLYFLGSHKNDLDTLYQYDVNERVLTALLEDVSARYTACWEKWGCVFNQRSQDTEKCTEFVLYNLKLSGDLKTLDCVSDSGFRMWERPDGLYYAALIGENTRAIRLFDGVQVRTITQLDITNPTWMFWSADSGWVVIGARTDPESNTSTRLYVVDADASEGTPVYTTENFDTLRTDAQFGVEWAGDKLVYNGEKDGQQGLYATQIPSGETILIYPFAEIDNEIIDHDISDDGRWLVLSMRGPEYDDYHVHIASLDGRQPISIPARGAEAGIPICVGWIKPDEGEKVFLCDFYMGEG